MPPRARTGCGFPVDVSTSAQATLGGMAGNNSCGSRSIAYGNMVHNVLGHRCVAVRRRRVEFGPVAIARTGAPRASPHFVRELAARIARASPSAGPRCCAAWAATTSTSSTTRASGLHAPTAASTSRICWSARKARSAFTRALRLKLAPAPRASGARRRQFPDLSCRNAGAAAYRQARAERGGADGPHHDRSGARQSGLPPAARARSDRAVRPRSCWSSSAGDELAPMQRAKLAPLGAN